MTGSACRSLRSCAERFMMRKRDEIEKNRGRGLGWASADDGKRFVEVPLGTSCAERCVGVVFGAAKAPLGGSAEGGGRRDSPPIGPIGG